MKWEQGKEEDENCVKDERKPHGSLRLRGVFRHSKDAILSRYPRQFNLIILMPALRPSPFSRREWSCRSGSLPSRMEASHA
jgi:hypothetical protein